jgi:formamidopyrimidine-DNA glycosylase
VEILDPLILRNTSNAEFAESLVGAKIGTPARHGKWMLTPAGSTTLLIHFGMTGLLALVETDQPLHRHDRVALHLSGGTTIRFRDQRRFGGLWLKDSRTPLNQITGPLGPDALTVGIDEFAGLVAGRRGAIKSTLMNKHVVAGIGNLLSDEILWQDRTHPALKQPDRIDSLFCHMQSVLSASASLGYIPGRADWLTGVRDRRNPRCPRCGTSLIHSKIASRTACWCPSCQPVPR